MAVIFWSITLVFVFSGSALAFMRIRRGQRTQSRNAPNFLPAVSVLKPLKGADPGLRENLESFFLLDYPDFELLFSVAEANDPAISVVTDLRKRYPGVSSRLFVGAENAGLNPKVNNLTRSYRQAIADVILISDSNVRVEPSYLRKKVSFLKPGVGVVTATVAGISPKGIGGILEATYLNTFYARGMSLAFATGNPCVVGKSMMFRRSVAAEFGGIRALADFLAEDYALGEAMRKMGLGIALMDDAVCQHIGSNSFRSFWDRHLRWGRIRKAHAPAAFLAEPFFTPVLTSLVAAVALQGHAGFTAVVLMNLCLWACCDLILMKKLTGHIHAWAPAGWLLRELLSLPLWLAVASGNSVQWRGITLFLSYGGKIQARDEEWQSKPSSGEPLRARIRLRETMTAATGGLGKPQVILREG